VASSFTTLIIWNRPYKGKKERGVPTAFLGWKGGDAKGPKKRLNVSSHQKKARKKKVDDAQKKRKA